MKQSKAEAASTPDTTLLLGGYAKKPPGWSILTIAVVAILLLLRHLPIMSSTASTSPRGDPVGLNRQEVGSVLGMSAVFILNATKEVSHARARTVPEPAKG